MKLATSGKRLAMTEQRLATSNPTSKACDLRRKGLRPPATIGRLGENEWQKQVARRRFQSKKDASSFGWVYSGSHNFSAAAWGHPISNSLRTKVVGAVKTNSVLGSRLHVCNYELGIVFIVPPSDANGSPNHKSRSLDDCSKTSASDTPATKQAMREALAEWEREISLEAIASGELMEEEIPDEEEEVLEATDYVAKEREDEKAYADILWSQRASSLEADGPIKDMTLITDYTGDVDYIKNREHDDCDSMMTLLLAKDPSNCLLICSDKRGNIARFINGINNHTPERMKKQNLKCVRYSVNGECQVLLVATRDIAKGERLYYDYNGYEHEYPTHHFERLMLNTLQFNMSIPAPCVFLIRYLKAAQSDRKQLGLLSIFLIDLCLKEYEILKFLPSFLAATTIYTAKCTIFGFKQWSKTCEWHTSYSEDQLLNVRCHVQL
ncbi:unnamed protein product [Camellia sinensis]